ncbi:Vitamin K-dependent gamma-carboxylase [Blattella germanica]|nr:Vitamin K-dependent gamma-carboxylase [Blattella germanica]
MNVKRRREGTYLKAIIPKHSKDNSQKSKKDSRSSNNDTKHSKFKEEIGLCLEDIKSWENFVNFMYKPMDPASLGLIRIMFGAFGIMLGLYFRISCIAYIIPYWFIFMLDKTAWNNHSYLFGIISILLLGSNAHHFWSLDILLGRVKRNYPVPVWNYFILRFQIFILYFYAGLKKMDRDWLEGYSMRNLSYHDVFAPFKRTGMFPYVCLVTMPIFCNANWPRKILKYFSRSKYASRNNGKEKEKQKLKEEFKEGCEFNKIHEEFPKGVITWKQKLVVFLLITHMGLQMFLPYSHFITKGYNNWTHGLYGYSWDMMVHTWDTVLVLVKVVDHETGKEHFLDPEAWVQSSRWEKHGDMVVQYAQCLQRKLLKGISDDGEKTEQYELSKNISIYIDVWCSLNGRFQQRMFDPRVDLLTVNWSPFKEVSFLMPLLTEFSDLRSHINALEKEVYSWSNFSDALFVADFPGLSLENYINEDLGNVTLTVLEGEVIVETEIIEEGQNIQKKSKSKAKISHKRLKKESMMNIPVGRFHRILTVSDTPSCYMYSYINETKKLEEEKIKSTEDQQSTDSIKKENRLQKFIKRVVDSWARSIGLVSNALLNILYSVPMVKRVRVA